MELLLKTNGTDKDNMRLTAGIPATNSAETARPPWCLRLPATLNVHRVTKARLPAPSARQHRQADWHVPIRRFCPFSIPIPQRRVTPSLLDVLRPVYNIPRLGASQRFCALVNCPNGDSGQTGDVQYQGHYYPLSCITELCNCRNTAKEA